MKLKTINKFKTFLQQGLTNQANDDDCNVLKQLSSQAAVLNKLMLHNTASNRLIINYLELRPTKTRISVNNAERQRV